MNRWRALTVAVALVLGATGLPAHDGHVHKVMGTITSRNATRIELKTPGGEVLSIAVNEKTAVTRNKKKAALTDVQKGVRAVVDIGNGEDPLIARGIELGATKISEP